MKILGKELTFNGNKVYHAGDKPTVSEIGAEYFLGLLHLMVLEM